MSLGEIVTQIAHDAREASLVLAAAPSEKKNLALKILARLIRENQSLITSENQKDLDAATTLSNAFRDRLALTPKRIEAMAAGVEEVAELADPVGQIISETHRPNGLLIQKIRTPIGVIGIIYESRPNVTVDCASLCLKSGNASILRGGKEAFNSNMCLARIIAQALEEAGLPSKSVQIIPTGDRAAMNTLLKLDQFVNCIIPRGGESLIRFVVENSTIPVIKHYKGVCTIYVDEFADAEMAKAIAVNAKCQRPGTCNAAENLIVHESQADAFLEIAKALSDSGVEIRADGKALELLRANTVVANEANEEDFGAEYTDMIISARLVKSLDEAVKFVNAYGSGHSDAIVTNNPQNAELFLNSVDSAAVYWNASTRFTDGFEFGLGAEIGISTDKLHARGPMGLDELCIYKYKIFGSGQTRS